MRKLIILVALSLSASAAWAQADKAPAVTKLPGEENLSLRERAERDFLMPVRRKRAAELAKQQPTASVEQLTTAAPENDAITHYSEAAPDPRTDEAAVAVAHEAHASRSRAARHTALLAARRTSATRSTSRSTKAKRTTKASKAAKASKAVKVSKAKTKTKAKVARKATKATATRSTKKAATHKAKAVATKAKHHTAAKKATTKTKVKAKPAAKQKRRR